VIPGPFSLPDLSRLDGELTANYIVSVTIGRGFPPGDAQHLVTAFVRSTDGALRRYEEARVRLERSVREDSIVQYLRGADDLELAFLALHRTMRLAEGLMRSPETSVGKTQLPSQGSRDLLRVMRNAIDHLNEPIIEGRAGKGHPLQLEVRDDHSTIADEAGTHAVLTPSLGSGYGRSTRWPSTSPITRRTGFAVDTFRSPEGDGRRDPCGAWPRAATFLRSR
jgi:hypothetical protein